MNETNSPHLAYGVRALLRRAVAVEAPPERARARVLGRVEAIIGRGREEVAVVRVARAVLPDQYQRLGIASITSRKNPSTSFGKNDSWST